MFNYFKGYWDSFWLYKDLLKQLVIRDLKLKYRRSFLGYIWSVLNPLLIMIVMVAVLSTLFKSDIKNFPVYLLSGQVMFNFMTGATQAGIFSIIDNGTLLKKTYVPKYIFTLSRITSALVDFVFSLGALIIVMLLTNAGFSKYNLLFWTVILQLYIFCIGLGMLLAALNVFFRDIQYIYNAFIMAWSYFTPLFYPIEILPKNIRWIEEHLNPMYFYIKQFRQLVYENTMPDLRLIALGWITAVIFFVVGVVVFKKLQDKFILYI